MRKIDLVLAAWFAVSMVFWLVFCLTQKTFAPFVPYYIVWVGVVGAWTWRRRHRIAERLQAWNISPPLKFLLLGYATVLAEEILAALANNVLEGFSPLLYIVRIGQFWALNIFAFSGFISGWCLVLRYFAYTRREVFYLAGLWGLYAEKVVFSLLGNPAFFLFSSVPAIFTYGLIITPALLSSDNYEEDRRHLPSVVKYPLTYIVLFILSVPPIFLLGVLRHAFPLLFPPPALVAL